MLDSPGKRLASFRASIRLSQRAFAAEVGTSHPRIVEMEKGKAALSTAFLAKISARYGVSADWLLHGIGDMLMPHGGFGGDGSAPRVEPPNRDQPIPADLVMDQVKYVRVRRMDLDVSAGNGLGETAEGPGEAVLLPRDWLVSRRLAPDMCVLVRVRGDSMAPAIPDGAFLLVNGAERHSGQPGVYALTWRGEAFAKRLTVLSRTADGRPEAVLLVSDNAAYPPVTIAGPDLAELRIAGRVRAVFAFL
jgi:phage repressor protein C with HTH and peptisase S24 domain